MKLDCLEDEAHEADAPPIHRCTSGIPHMAHLWHLRHLLRPDHLLRSGLVADAGQHHVVIIRAVKPMSCRHGGFSSE